MTANQKYRYLSECKKKLLDDILHMTEDELREQAIKDIIAGQCYPWDWEEQGISHHEIQIDWMNRHKYLLLD